MALGAYGIKRPADALPDEVALKHGIAGTPDDIEGKTFVYRRVKSEKSPSGYAHSWKLD